MKYHVFGMALILSSTVFAQQEPPAPSPGTKALRQAQEAQAPRPAFAPPRGREELTAEQREKLNEITTRYRTEQQAFAEKLRETRSELDQAVTAVPADEALIRQKAALIGQIEGDLAVIRSRMYGEYRAIGITPPTSVRPRPPGPRVGDAPSPNRDRREGQPPPVRPIRPGAGNELRPSTPPPPPR